MYVNKSARHHILFFHIFFYHNLYFPKKKTKKPKTCFRLSSIQTLSFPCHLMFFCKSMASFCVPHCCTWTVDLGDGWEMSMLLSVNQCHSSPPLPPPLLSFPFFLISKGILMAARAVYSQQDENQRLCTCSSALTFTMLLQVLWSIVHLLLLNNGYVVILLHLRS